MWERYVGVLEKKIVGKRVYGNIKNTEEEYREKAVGEKCVGVSNTEKSV